MIALFFLSPNRLLRLWFLSCRIFFFLMLPAAISLASFATYSALGNTVISVCSCMMLSSYLFQLESAFVLFSRVLIHCISWHLYRQLEAATIFRALSFFNALQFPLVRACPLLLPCLPL